MTLDEFLEETRDEIAVQMSDGSPFAELVFCEVVMQHLVDAGMTFEPVVCHFQGKVGNAKLRLSGYAMSDDADQLDLFVSLNAGFESVTPIQDQDYKTAGQQCVRFLVLCAEGRLADKLDPSSDAHSLALTIREIYDGLEQVRVFVLTDGVAKSKSFKARDVGGKSVRLEVMDIERLFRHRSEGKPRDELVIDFREVSGSPLPCVYVPGQTDDYDYALTASPAEVLRFVYEKFGARLLEANVRSFLSITSKRGVNAGIQNSLRSAPERFLAYNNGIVLVADEIKLDKAEDGSPGILWLRGMQIVNGGQTTASIYFTKKKYPETDLTKVRVPAKIEAVARLLRPEKIKDRYEIKEELQHGSLAVVYLARDLFEDRDVALKIMKHKVLLNLAYRRRFQQEKQVVTSVQHTAVVPVYDVDLHNGQPYLAMRFMEGASLRERLRKERTISVEAVCQLGERLAQALDAIHQSQYAHGGVNLSNVLLDTAGNGYLADFHINHLAELTEVVVAQEDPLGYLPYLAPEQWQGEPASQQTDVYQFGVLLFELLTRHRPFPETAVAELRVSIVTQLAPLITTVNSFASCRSGAPLTVGRVCRLQFVRQRQVAERRSFNFQRPRRPLSAPVATDIARKYIKQSWRLP